MPSQVGTKLVQGLRPLPIDFCSVAVTTLTCCNACKDTADGISADVAIGVATTFFTAGAWLPYFCIRCCVANYILTDSFILRY